MEGGGRSAHCKTRQQGDEKLNHALNVKLSRESRWKHKEYITCDAEQQFFKLPSPLLILIYPLQRSWSRSRRFCHLRMKPCVSIILSPLQHRAIFFSGLQLYNSTFPLEPNIFAAIYHKTEKYSPPPIKPIF